MITEFKTNSGGINLTDSPLTIKDNQATGSSYNYDYLTTGAISKVLGKARINSIADAQLKTLGLGLHHSVTTDARTVIRAAGTKLQVADIGTGSLTNLTEDTTAVNSDFLSASSTQQVVNAPFNASSNTQLWMVGGGMASIYGYTGSSITKNGADPATGTVGLSLTGSGSGGVWSITGTRFYSVVLRKTQTLAQSNAALDISINVDDVTKKVTVDLSTLTIDTTKYDQILLYRSAVSGVTAFTTGDLVTTLASTATTYSDDGSSSVSAQVVPRTGNTTDNTALGVGTYKSLTTFKRRLVTAKNSEIIISDLNKPESWRARDRITIPTGGPILALGVIGYNSPFSTGADEFLAIFKENELWCVTGTGALDTDGIPDWELKFVDRVGITNQAALVPLNGYVAWINYAGAYLWDGHGKPIYCSRPIESLFGADGDLDKPKLPYSFGVYYEKSNQVVWRASHRVKGEQRLSIKLDTRFTSQEIGKELEARVINGIFILDTDTDNALYAGLAYRPTNFEEQFLAGDDAGFLLKMYGSPTNPSNAGIMFSYETRPLDMGKPQQNKLFKRVIVWIERIVDKDLRLNYWSDFRNRPDEQSTAAVSMAPRRGAAPSLWDVANWDQAYWDDYTADIDTIEFNLHGNENNATGASLKLQFVQSDPNCPVRIHGFAIEWEEDTPKSESA